MTISVKHAFASPKADGTDSTLVQPSNWNAEHTITLAAGKVLGRDSSGSGAMQELPISVDSTGQSLIPPLGTTAQRPATPVSGMFRYNSTTSSFEGYTGSAWGNIGGSSGTVSSVAVSGGSTGLTTSGGPVTTSGTITIAGTLAAANGGTGLTAPGTSGNVLTSNGTTWTSAAAAAGGFSNMQVFTSSGTFTVPAGITKVKVTVVGAGGGGGGTNSTTFNTFSAGGAGGGTAIKTISGLTPAGTVSVTVGTGGGGGSGSGVGSAGGTSSFGAYCSASGGSGGQSNYDNSCATFIGGSYGTGGLGSSGDLNIRGSYPALAAQSLGLTGTASFMGGTTAINYSGGAVNGITGASYGGGGSGAYSSSGSGSRTGGTGGSGVVIVEY